MHHRESEQCFLLKEIDGTVTTGGGEVSAELNPTVAIIQCYFLLSVRDNISKCLGLTLIVFNLFLFYSESLFSFKMETSTLRC